MLGFLGLHRRPMIICLIYSLKKLEVLKRIQQNFSGSNTDGSSTTAVSNSFLCLLEKNRSGRLRIIKGNIENGMLHVLDEAILMRKHNIPSC